MAPSPLPRRTIPLLILGSSILLLQLLISPTHADIVPVRWMAYAAMEGKALFVQGGYGDTSNTAQFLVLNLTHPQTWTTTIDTSPPWKSLSPGPLNHFHYGALSNDQEDLYIWTENDIPHYHIPSDRWLSSIPLPAGFVGRFSLKAGTDPGTGKIYVPFGYTGDKMAVFDPKTGKGSSVSMPEGLKLTIRYTWIWSTVRKSFLFYGGYQSLGESLNQDLYEFQPEKSQWTRLIAQGAIPAARNYHCMATAQNGSSMVLFGGESAEHRVLGDIYILDTKTLAWTQDSEASTNMARSGMACAGSGDNFVVWGGANTGSRMDPSFTKPIVYNLKARIWTDQYSLTGDISTTSSPIAAPTDRSSQSSDDGTGNGDSDESSRNRKTAIAAGSAAGFIILVVFIAVIVHRRYKAATARTEAIVAARRHQQQISDDVDDAHHNGVGTGSAGHEDALEESDKV